MASTDAWCPACFNTIDGPMPSPTLLLLLLLLISLPVALPVVASSTMVSDCVLTTSPRVAM